ncbi:MAG: phosphotransferase [Saprospiraceae bacterium]|nr:phosphotransferase [Saprospiraceae bacterium]
MTSEQIHSMVAEGGFPGPSAPVDLVETHISWVILTPTFAFKIKKPVRFPFLDFSTLEKRAHYCLEELRLNRRLAPDMYLDVLPIIFSKNGIPAISQTAADEAAMDFAVAMKRMDNGLQMDKLLRQHAVTLANMETLAAMLARFHRTSVLDGQTLDYEPSSHRADFDDLFRLEATAQKVSGAAASKQFEAWRNQVGTFLNKHEPRLHERALRGFWVEGHGDLHARNIFLLPQGPVVFDCIEFNPHFRQLDVLNELAFLCMDLEANGHPELAAAFMKAYCHHWPCLENAEDERLFLYFKAYRANVRLKVALTEWEQHPAPTLEASAATYQALLARYLQALE